MTELNLEIAPKLEATDIPGLIYIPDYIAVDEQNQLLAKVDQQEWSIDSVESKRRIQQLGYRYVYKNGFLVGASYLGALPDWANSIASRLSEDALITTVLDQVTVNEYYPGQGLRSHIDCITCFGNAIITLSLGSFCVMNFTHTQTKEKRQILLSPGSLLMLRGEARYGWEHSVEPQIIDKYKGEEFVRTRRVALTFREALFPHK